MQRFSSFFIALSTDIMSNVSGTVKSSQDTILCAENDNSPVFLPLSSAPTVQRHSNRVRPSLIRDQPSPTGWVTHHPNEKNLRAPFMGLAKNGSESASNHPSPPFTLGAPLLTDDYTLSISS
jgi:hypothetical protein